MGQTNRGILSEMKTNISELKQKIENLDNLVNNLQDNEAISFDTKRETTETVKIVEKVKIVETIKKETLSVSDKRQAWYVDLPGAKVSNLHKAIPLNDRLVFISELFYGESEAFDRAIQAFNNMDTFPEAVDYIKTNFPSWDLSSEIVYRIIMLIRRKLQ